VAKSSPVSRQLSTHVENPGRSIPRTDRCDRLGEWAPFAEVSSAFSLWVSSQISSVQAMPGHFHRRASAEFEGFGRFTDSTTPGSADPIRFLASSSALPRPSPVSPDTASIR
jgi:hypothetical protein